MSHHLKHVQLAQSYFLFDVTISCPHIIDHFYFITVFTAYKLPLIALFRLPPPLSLIRNLLKTYETVIILPDIAAFTRFQTAKGDLNEIAFCCRE